MHDSDSGPTIIRRDLLWLAAGAGLLFASFLGARDLWNPNEPLYGRAVVEMAERGDWLLPTVNGETFDEKPILYYWMALAAAALFGGVNEFTLRIPAALSGVLSVLLIYLFVLPYAGPRRARLAAALLGTTFIIYWSSRSVQMDILIGLTTLAAILAVCRVLDHRLDPLRGWSFAGFAVGLGFLAKGPVGLICPGMVGFIYMLTTGRLNRLRVRPILSGAVIFLAVALPWFLLLWATGEGASVTEMLYRQNFARFADSWDHHQPWWYFLGYFWIDMAPWAIFVPLAAALPERDGSARRLDRLAWIWIAATIVFFSLSESKRSAYILPLAPAVAILVSGVAERWFLGTLRRHRRRACLVLFGLFGTLAIIAAGFLHLSALKRYPIPGFAGAALITALIAGGVSILLGVLLASRFRRLAPLGLFGLILSFYLLTAAFVLPAVDTHKSARRFCQEMNTLVGPANQLRSYRPWKWRASYIYYAGRPIPRVISTEGLRTYWDSREPVFLLVEGHRLEEARTILGDLEPLVSREVGSKQVHLFTNR